MTIPAWFRLSAIVLMVTLLVTRSVDLTAGNNDYDVSQVPLFSGQSDPPLMMLVMSRDEQLFNKAYPDYTDLNEDGKLDTTYQDRFDYAGYFDPKLCYAYNNGKFKAAGQANGHKCSNQWSGNFLNWVTMSRLDILRFVLYGGQRSTDNATTVLERANIPSDLHAWVKVYSGSDIGSYTPLSGPQTFCNTSTGINSDPLMRVASGNWSEWAATAVRQCAKRGEVSSGDDDRPSGTITDITVRVEVCDPRASAANRESFCQKYSSGTTDSFKPVGLLQTYGEAGRLRFGMVSGTFSKPRSGGVLRRNIGRLAGNSGTATGCTAGDEVDLSNGRFCNQTDGTEGIINTLSRLKLTQWNYSHVWNDCNTWGYLNRQGFSDAGNGSLNNPGTGTNDCNAWGNPLAEMYAEALRYVAGQTTATSAFAGGTDLLGMPVPTWSDPYRAPERGGNSFCATCNILVMSSGLPSFDSDEVPTVQPIAAAATATDNVGTGEGLSGSYMVGRVVANQAELAVGNSVNTHEDICTGKSLGAALSRARGLCPDVPSMEGSYLMSGLAHQARITDMRPGLQGKPAGYKNTVTTYAVAMAENLPKFDIPVGNGKITLSPLCQANKSGTAKINGGSEDKNWRTCFLGSVGVGKKESRVSPYHVYGRDLESDGSAGSFSLVWEDSLWGNDHDNDVVSMMTYCVGSACNANTNPRNTSYNGKDICWRSDSPVCGANGSPSVGANEVLVRIENMSAYAGNAMMTGFTVTGSNDDGVKRLALRPGSSDNSILTTQADPPTNWFKPKVLKFTLGTSNAKLLESPLWYAAKYGGFKDSNGNNLPDLASEWSTRQPGTPDNYFLARDPSKLKTELDRIFAEAAGSKAPTGGAGGGARITGNSFTLEATYELKDGTVNDWIGNVRGVQVKQDGSAGNEIWNAEAKLPTASSRNKIFMVTEPTRIRADGTVSDEASAASFTGNNIPGTTREAKLASMGMPAIPTWFRSTYSVNTLVSYIKGDHSNERGKGADSQKTLRNRSSALGDIINSTPEIASPRDDFGYANWASFSTVEWKRKLGGSYGTYLTTKATRTPVIYVGANDGMLHGFSAKNDASGGEELFAFIPSGSLDHLASLADPNLLHRYYLDGPVTTSDVPFSAEGDWHTVLVGTQGAGGKSVFGLDVSTPGAFDDDDVLWELSGKTVNELGMVMGKPVVVPVKSTGGKPRWVAIFGNGVNSDSGAPVLFVVDAKDGTVLARLKPSETDYAVRNGLMSIAPVALSNNDGIVDTVYGGDLQGNVWKFDLSDENPEDWTIAYSEQPLFTAKIGDVAQPITGGIEVATGQGGGVNIFFGTGRYFVVGDNQISADPPVQSLYGILDNLGAVRIAGRDELVEQTISNVALSNGYTTRDVSNNLVSYGTKRGWYIDLKVDDAAKGERFIGTPRVQNGKVIFTTYEGIDATCSAGGGNNWLYALNLLSGAGGMSGVSNTRGGNPVCTGDCGAISLNKEGKNMPPVKDTNVFVPPPPTLEELNGLCNIATDPTCLQKRLDAKECTFVLRAPGADPLFLPRPCGRQSWRQVR
ncbi:pilus assembly protein [Luteimonas aquatica]|uniref:pilus assembly protein n=1 Tax=Luteimonas aquatica TaxID=450364 RepID=UPI001F5955CE|nr:PilC/PilY family type IV pilus protein [Luteimonas aquatica]